jgi:hypothetical protein
VKGGGDIKRRFGLMFPAVALLAALASPVPARAQATPGPTSEIIARGDVDATTVAGYRAVFEQVASFYAREFGPIPIPMVRIRLYETTEIFAQGLIDLAHSPESATRLAGLFSGFAVGRDTIIINLARKPGQDRPRARLRWAQYVVAHETLHLIQRAWMGDAAWEPTWLINGMAETYTLRFFRWIGDEAMYNHIRRGTLGALRARLADLLFIVLSYTVEDWIRAHAAHGRAEGFPVIYAFMRVAYEYLESRTSKEAMLAFFAARRDGASTREAFSRAFGMTPEEFEAALRYAVQRIVIQGLWRHRPKAAHL